MCTTYLNIYLLPIFSCDVSVEILAVFISYHVHSSVYPNINERNNKLAFKPNIIKTCLKLGIQNKRSQTRKTMIKEKVKKKKRNGINHYLATELEFSASIPERIIKSTHPVKMST